MSKKRLLYLAPHLSTGGQPQFLKRKIQLLKNEFEIFLIEWANLSDQFTVQKNQIRALLPETHFFTLSADKRQVLTIINQIKPDILHLEEIPEYFIPVDIAKEIYKKDRPYLIFETTHSSDLDPSRKIFRPDKYLFVCPFSAIQYASDNVPSEVIEYPIDNLAILKNEARTQLNFSPDYKHVVVVGLFTPRKNQAYAFKLAERLQDFNIQFHFVGNQAENFQYYWAPLLANKPTNCLIWGERSDVDTFLCAADLSLFPSEGKNGDKELNPLIIKESLEAKVPILMYNLDVYLRKYDNHPGTHFLSGNIETDAQKIINLVDPNKSQSTILSYLLDAYISAWYDRTDNKIYIRSNYIKPLEFSCCVVKEIDSGTTIYFTEKIRLTATDETWILPINGFSFWDDQFCGGFLLEFLDEQKNVVVRKEIRLRQPTERIQCPGLDPLDCSYINYREFFCIGVYDHLNFSNLETVVDVGASVGLFTKYIIHKGAKQVFALEPIIKAFKSLVAVNPTAKCFNVALDPVTGTKDIYFTDDNTTISRFLDNLLLTERYQYNRKEVFTINWKDFCLVNQIDKVSLLKVDIEGHEYPVFNAFDADDLAKIDQIILEFHGNANGELLPVFTKLQENGFNLVIHKQSTKQLGSINDHDGILFATK